jgi:hypothetical protein
MANKAKTRNSFVFAGIGILVVLSALILTASEKITVRAGLSLALVGLILGFVPTFLIRRNVKGAS